MTTLGLWPATTWSVIVHDNYLVNQSVQSPLLWLAGQQLLTSADCQNASRPIWRKQIYWRLTSER